jgi:hypothetical protein
MTFRKYVENVVRHLRLRIFLILPAYSIVAQPGLRPPSSKGLGVNELNVFSDFGDC